jgi:hypothetical protein
LRAINEDIDKDLLDLAGRAGEEQTLPRQLVRDLDLDELAELLLWAARAVAPDIELEARLLSELALFAKTARASRRRPLNANLWLEIRRENIALTLASKPI